MKNTRLLDLLESFNNKELKLLHKWVKSPFFNQRKDVIDLFGLYERHRSMYKDVPTKKQIFNRLYGKEKYDDHKVRLVISILYQLTCQFLVYQSQQGDPLKYKMDLSKLFLERKLEKDFLRTLREVKKNQEKATIKDTLFYFHEYSIFELEYEYESNKSRDQIHSFQSVLDNLDIYVISEKLRQCSIAISHKRQSINEYNLGLITPIIEYVEQHPHFLDYPNIALYFHFYKIITKENENDHIVEFTKILYQYTENFPKKELHDFYLVAINHYIRKFNNGEPGMTNIIFDLYKEALQKDLFLHNNKIVHFSFKNIVTASLFAKKDKWAEAFIKEYSPYLDEVIRTPLHTYSLARLDHFRGQHKKALDALLTIKFKEGLFSLSQKTLIAKIYYETEAFDLLDNHLTALQTYIRRNDPVHDKLRSYYLNFALFLQKILNTNRYDKQSKQKLYKEFEKYKPIVDKFWIEKVLADF